MSEGRPTRYREEYAEQARKLCLLGATDAEMANFFEVCVATIQNWKNDFPEFLDSIKAGKIKADAHLASKLYSRAEGAEWTEEQAIKIKVGQFEERVEVVSVKRSAPPETAALIHWLNNRRSGNWRSAQSLQQLDKDGKPADPPTHTIIRYVGQPPPEAGER